MTDGCRPLCASLQLMENQRRSLSKGEKSKKERKRIPYDFYDITASQEILIWQRYTSPGIGDD